MKIIYTLLFSIVLSLGLAAQHETATHGAEAVEEHHEKSGGISEFIATGLYAYNFEHDEGAFGTEFHYTYWFTHVWGGGVSYTLKFEDEETVNDIALIGSVNPASWLTVNAGVNFAIGTEHRHYSTGLYAETEFNIRPTERFHFGPVIGTVVSGETELTGGIHLGFEF